MEQHTAHSDDRSGLIGGITGLIKSTYGLLMGRVEIAAIELAEMRTNLLKLFVVFSLGVVAVWFAIAYWTALLVYLSWDELGWKILMLIALFFTVVAVGVFLYIRSHIAKGVLAMPITMEELRNDRDALL
jgi:uncharacterized membrane protein YqjE